jgi:hypothetical protein
MKSETREAMNGALKELVVPALRALGFMGSLPHFRRVSGDSLDLLTFQFDKWGGGFVIEIARSLDKPVTTYWGKVVSPTKLTAHDLHADQRFRIQPRAGSGVDAWFRFDDGRVDEVAKEVLANLPRAEAWWREKRQAAAQV